MKSNYYPFHKRRHSVASRITRKRDKILRNGFRQLVAKTGARRTIEEENFLPEFLEGFQAGL